MDLSKLSMIEQKELFDAIADFLPSQPSVARRCERSRGTIANVRAGLSKDPAAVAAYFDMCRSGWESAVPVKYKYLLLQTVSR